MLFDLTKISGQRVDQVDEIQLVGRQWIRTTDLFIFFGGCVAGAFVCLPLHMLFGGWLPYLAIPAGGITAVVLLARKRSVAGEVHRRRLERIVDARRKVDGRFILPGGESFSVNSYRIVQMHDHPYCD